MRIVVNSITDMEICTELKLQCSPLVNFAYLMGSAGTERFHEESDIDLAVHWKVEPEFSEILKISAALSQSFNREVDLVSLNRIDLIFGRQVLETGRLLFCSEPGIHLQWKADQLSRYPDFKFTRGPIEKNILVRKKYV
jgi:predicted nucleotidyltransferase